MLKPAGLTVDIMHLYRAGNRYHSNGMSENHFSHIEKSKVEAKSRESIVWEIIWLFNA